MYARGGEETGPREPARGQNLPANVGAWVSTSQNTARSRKDTTPPYTAEGEHRRPWHGWQKDQPASTSRLLTTFTPSKEYNLTRLTPEEAAAYIEQLKREREKNGG
jgi:hypothetical protein